MRWLLVISRGHCCGDVYARTIASQSATLTQVSPSSFYMSGSPAAAKVLARTCKYSNVWCGGESLAVTWSNSTLVPLSLSGDLVSCVCQCCVLT